MLLLQLPHHLDHHHQKLGNNSSICTIIYRVDSNHINPTADNSDDIHNCKGVKSQVAQPRPQSIQKPRGRAQTFRSRIECVESQLTNGGTGGIILSTHKAFVMILGRYFYQHAAEIGILSHGRRRPWYGSSALSSVLDRMRTMLCSSSGKIWNSSLSHRK